MTVTGTEQRVYGTLLNSTDGYFGFAHAVNGAIITYCDDPRCINNPVNTMYSNGLRVARFNRGMRYLGDVTYYFEDFGGNTWDSAFEYRFVKNNIEFWAYSVYGHDYYNSVVVLETSTRSWRVVCEGTNTMLPNPYHEISPVSRYSFTEKEKTLYNLHVIQISSPLIIIN